MSDLTEFLEREKADLAADDARLERIRRNKEGLSELKQLLYAKDKLARLKNKENGPPILSAGRRHPGCRVSTEVHALLDFDFRRPADQLRSDECLRGVAGSCAG